MSSTTTYDRQLGVRLLTPGQMLSAPDDSTVDMWVPATRTEAPPRQLSPLDRQMLDVETDTTPLHVGALVLLDSAAAERPLDVVSLRRLFARRLHRIPALCRRLRTVPLGLDQPYWETCGTVDLSYHIRDVRLPDGADDRQVADYVARQHEAPLDRSRPMWECRLLSGLSGGRQAVYMKVHHAVIDGVSGAEIMGAVLDADATGTPTLPPAGAVPQDRAPGLATMLARSLTNVVERPGAGIRSLLSAVPALLRSVDDLRQRHPDVPFNEPNTAARSFAFVSLPLDQVKAVKNTVGGTVNDVVMTLCATAVRQWMLDRGIAADRPLLAAIPVSVRTPEEFGTAGNRFSVMLSTLPTDEADPRHRLKLMHENMVTAKAHFRSLPPDILHQAGALLTPLLHGLPTRGLLRAAASSLPLVNLLVSNVPGPQIPLYLNGIRALGSYPVSVLTPLSGGMNITVMSYDGHLDFGIIACPDTVPDIDRIAAGLKQGLAELSRTSAG
ncbi:WS/DGAT/MGAT family O-acyltransferase [Nocardia stercoris]|uniref:Diacylglycerol O-acyltransferase n=1 Tax=Nocardia stercoris TaxID=2483361 RepID=A0A3M2L5G4_9NOCA|nr:wax ester/triacylglycerol synthase family O-acyltransferase [Nocardia stercoris]RMI32634.1 wax ester/triacylglycerol synthase family O-acyltransferase [Nocardia stercoris]